MRRIVAGAAFACVVSMSWAHAQDRRGYMGVNLAASGDRITHGEQSWTGYIRLTTVVPDAPAARAGLLAEDRIVAVPGCAFGADRAANMTAFRGLLAGKKPGDVLALTILRDSLEHAGALDGVPVPDAATAFADPDRLLAKRPPGSTLTLTAVKRRSLLTIDLTLGARPSPPGWDRPVVVDAAFLQPAYEMKARALGDALVAEFETGDDYADLRRRLHRLTERGDPFKLGVVAAALRDPWKMGGLARAMAAPTAAGSSGPFQLDPYARWLGHSIDGAWPSSGNGTAPAPGLKTGLTAEAHAAQIRTVLDAAHAAFERAFVKLGPGERRTLAQSMPTLSQLFIDHVMWPVGRDDRRQATADAVRLAASVDVEQLCVAAAHCLTLQDPTYLAGLREDLKALPPLKTQSFDSPYGKIVFAGRGRHWHRKPAAVLIDLGGDDFYTQQSSRPFAIVIDWEGDDAYESSFDVSHGAGVLGIGILIDRSGNDRYLTQRWGLGAAACGVGVLIDVQGDDVYRGRDYTMGVAYCGIGVLHDRTGDDRYEAPRYSQGLGMPGGFGALVDEGAGADRYFCKGRDQTSYGDEGIFDGWGQGVGVGFRGMASGGLGLLRDGGGDDVYEAGNFSQGGGYYYGFGMLSDRGGNDLYIGSRYAQAFAAHQAVGFFEDHRGHDRYTTRQGVAQSCSWDETVTTFIDRSGNDVYEGGRFFSQGAAAHNGFALLVDGAGNDRYVYKPGQAQAKSNSYHGGTSFALFLDCGGGLDTYVGGKQKGADTQVHHRDQHGFQVDAAGDLPDAVKRFRKWIKR